MEQSKIRILLVDDHEAVLKGLSMLLAIERDMQVIGEARDGSMALKLALDIQPDVVVMDIQLPGMDGIAATREILKSVPDITIIILSIHHDPILRDQAREAGAAAYVQKQNGVSSLIKEIRKAIASKKPNAKGGSNS